MKALTREHRQENQIVEAPVDAGIEQHLDARVRAARLLFLLRTQSLKLLPEALHLALELRVAALQFFVLGTQLLHIHPRGSAQVLLDVVNSVRWPLGLLVEADQQRVSWDTTPFFSKYLR